jgi:polysaccharide biosynthesis protein PslH
MPSRVPLQAAYSRHPAAEARIRALVDGGGYDVVHIEHLRGALLAPSPCRLPTVYDAVDSITRLFEQTVRLAPAPRQRLMARLDVARTRRFEGTVGRRFDRVIVSSDAEARAFRELDRTRSGAFVRAVRNGVVLPRRGPRLDDGRTVLFAGKMSYHANEAAARRLAEHVMPLVWRSRPETRLVIAGKDPSPALMALAVPGRLEVTGFVDDLGAVMARATVMAAPLVYAAGIQNKVLESMASATPVVTTRSACAALDAEIGRDVLAADDDRAFADAILELLTDRARRDAVGAAGRAYVERHHDWGTLALSLVEVYREAGAVFAARTGKR